MNLLVVFMGGGAGAVARYLAGAGWLRAFGPAHPWLATGLVNVVGGGLMGVLVGWLALRGAGGSERWRLLLGVGVLGGFTTFSTYSLEVVGLIERRAYGTAAAYAAGSAVLSFAALFGALLLMRRVAA